MLWLKHESYSALVAMRHDVMAFLSVETEIRIA